MTKEQTKNHKYLGYGVYAEYNEYEIILRTGDHRDGYCDNKIYLEPEVYNELVEFVKENQRMNDLKEINKTLTETQARLEHVQEILDVVANRLEIKTKGVLNENRR